MGKYVFGVDLGGTTVKLGLFTTDGEVLDKWEIKTDTSNNGSKILPDIADTILNKIKEKNIEKSEVEGVGIGVPGPVDENGVVNKAANLGWGVFNLEEEFSNLTGLKVKGANDANVAALGEMWKGAARGYKNIVMVTLGTGIGGGVIVDGKIVTGSTGAGGEIGHIHVKDGETVACGCGNKGCFEQYCSATGIVRLAKKYLENETASKLRNEEVTAKAIFDAYKDGDELAKEILAEYFEILGKGFGIIGSILNPEVFVIGGGVSKAGNVITDSVAEHYKKYVFHASRDAKFVLAELFNDAGIYGSAKLVLG